MIIIKIATDFSDAPGGRYAAEGICSGEEFRISILEPKYLEAKEKKDKIQVDLDGGFGYLPSFLDEAFGELARKYKNDNVVDYFEFISFDEPGLIDKIIKCMKSPV